MPFKKVTIAAILLPFAAYSTWVLWGWGYGGIWLAGVQSAPAAQILIDLVIACSLICIWMIRDARGSGRNAWPFVALTLGAGSFGPLLYLLTAPSDGA